jgi:phosphatidylinositol-bisphosphatase
MESYKPHAILGILNIKEIDYILYVKIAKLVGIFNNNEVYTVKEAEVLPITIDSKQDEESSREIENIKSFLKIGFYYSFTYDLTNSIQKQSTYKSNNLYETVEKNNMWNFNLYKEFFTFKIDSCFFVYLIQGYVGILNYTILETNQEFSSMLISRRNWLNPFPGSVSKGINEDGNVANLVETEQLLFFNNIVHSYVFLRGNAPIHYQHSDNNIKIVKSPEQLKPLFMRHIQHIQKDFHFIYFVNMLSAHKLSEQAITTNLEIQFKNNEISNFCKYQYFHLEDTTHSPELENRLEKFTASIEKVLGLFKFFCQDLNYGRVFSEQTGVLRMICFNSLEKTNLVQMKISMKIFEFFV